MILFIIVVFLLFHKIYQISEHLFSQDIILHMIENNFFLQVTYLSDRDMGFIHIK